MFLRHSPRRATSGPLVPTSAPIAGSQRPLVKCSSPHVSHTREKKYQVSMLVWIREGNMDPKLREKAKAVFRAILHNTAKKSRSDSDAKASPDSDRSKDTPVTPNNTRRNHR